MHNKNTQTWVYSPLLHHIETETYQAHFATKHGGKKMDLVHSLQWKSY